MTQPEFDRKGLIREAYRIDGITEAECRSIFLDWALSLPVDIDQSEAIQAMIDHYAPDAQDHPMSAILEQGLVRMTRPRRRGGWRSRDRN